MDCCERIEVESRGGREIVSMWSGGVVVVRMEFVTRFAALAWLMRAELRRAGLAVPVALSSARAGVPVGGGAV